MATNAERAQAAIGVLMAFNPHQRRGPDGKWIKMGTAEKKNRRNERARERRAERKREQQDAPGPAVARAPSEPSQPTEDPAAAAALARYRDELDVYNGEMLELGQAWVETSNYPDQGLQHQVNRLRQAIEKGEHSQADSAAERIRGLLVDLEYQRDSELPVRPELEQKVELFDPRPSSDGPNLLSANTPYADRWLALQRAADGGVWGEEPIGQGVMGDTKRVLFNDGTPAIYKRAKGDYPLGGTGRDWTPKDQTDAEELAPVVASILDLRAPAVQRLSDTEIHMEYVENATDAYARFFDRDAPDFMRVSDDVLGSDDGFRLGLLDVLLDNPDRHGYNWLIDDEDRIYPIDHGLSFTNTQGPLRSAASRSPFAREYFVTPNGGYKENTLTRRDIEYLSQQLDAIRPIFQQMGRELWHDVMRVRLMQLDRLAKGRTHNLPAPEADEETP